MILDMFIEIIELVLDRDIAHANRVIAQRITVASF